MFEAFFVVVCLCVIAFLIYKWFELLILKRERFEALSRLDGENLLEYTKRIPIGLGACASAQQHKPSHPAAWPLRCGLLLLGLGFGMFVAWHLVLHQDVNHGDKELIFAGCVLMGGGLGLVVAFVIEHILYKKEE